MKATKLRKSGLVNPLKSPKHIRQFYIVRVIRVMMTVYQATKLKKRELARPAKTWG
jgi:hypothetical protein